MATTTTPKPKSARSVLVDLERREAEVAELEAKARDLGSESQSARNQIKVLNEERRKLIHREPALVDHRGRPTETIADNAILDVDKKLNACADAADLEAQHLHARQVADRAEQSVRDWTKSRTDALAEALAPMLRQHHTEAQARLDEAAEAVSGYSALARRFEVLTGQRLSAVEHLSGLHRLLKRNGVPQVGA
jgi:hypothetical protein